METVKSGGLTATSRTGLITNLLEGCCVEVPCLVDKEGIHPCHIGDLPSQCATLNRANIGEQELAVRGMWKKIKENFPVNPDRPVSQFIDDHR